MSLLDDKNDNIEKLFEDYMKDIKEQLGSEIRQQVMDNYNDLLNRYMIARGQIDTLTRHVQRLEEGITQMRLDKYDDSQVHLHIPSDLITDINMFKHELYL
jgi:hypothetical protein